MQYATGEIVELYDSVEIGSQSVDQGRVVCIIGEDIFSADYPREQWQYLKQGLMIEFQRAGLIYYEKVDEGLRLITRNKVST